MKKLLIATTIFLLAAACNKQPVQVQPASPDASQGGSAQNPPAPTPHAQQTRPADDTAVWKTYRNYEYGFELKYPQAWYVSDVTDVVSGAKLTLDFSPDKGITKNHLISDNYVKVSVFSKSDFESTGMLGFSKEDVRSITLGGYKGTWYKSTSDKGTYVEATNFVRMETDSYGYEISRMIPQEDYRNGNNIAMEKEFEQMLTTFNFTK